MVLKNCVYRISLHIYIRIIV